MTNLTLVKFIAITSLKCCKFSPHMASHLENWHLWSGLQAILAFLVSWSDFQTYSCVTWAKIWPKRALSENFGFQPLLDFQNMPRWNQWQLNCRRTRMKCRCIVCGMQHVCKTDWWHLLVMVDKWSGIKTGITTFPLARINYSTVILSASHQHMSSIPFTVRVWLCNVYYECSLSNTYSILPL